MDTAGNKKSNLGNDKKTANNEKNDVTGIPTSDLRKPDKKADLAAQKHRLESQGRGKEV